MASARIAELIAEMSPKEHKLVSREQARLERIGDDLEDEIIALARVNIFRGPAGSLDLTSGSVIVTQSRLIVVEQLNGGTSIVRYAEIERMNYIGGRKKLFGGYEDTCLIMSMRHSGEQQRWIVGHDPQWASRSAQAILGAHERHALKNS